MAPRSFPPRGGVTPLPVLAATASAVRAALAVLTLAATCVAALGIGGTNEAHATPAPAASPAASTARIPDTTLPQKPTVPRYVPRTEVERLQILGRADPDAAAEGLEKFIAGHPAPDLLRLQALQVLGGEYNAINRGEDSERVARLLDAMSDALPDARPLAMIVRANWLLSKNETAKAERLVIEASPLVTRSSPYFVRLSWLSASGSIKRHTGHIDDALRRYHEAIPLIEQEGGMPWREIDSRLALAGALLDAMQYDKCEEILREVEVRAAAMDDEEALASIANERSIKITQQHEDDPAALQASVDAIEHARRAGARHDLVLYLANLADYYLRHGDFQTANEVSRRALPMARELKDDSSTDVALANMGLSLIGMHRKDEGMPYMREAAAIDERTSTASDIAAAMLEMGGYLERAGYAEDALAAYRQYRQLAEDAGQQDRQRAVLELQETFANERREHELEMLSREGRLKDEEIRHHDLEVKEWTAAGIASLLLAGVVAVLARRMRARNQQLTASNEALRIQAERDPLTGLANRHYLQAAMAARPAGRGLEGTLYLLDVDHFKHINDRCGHAGGDTVLIEIAHRLRETLRGDDLIVRWGGEEFLVLVKPMPVGESEALAQRLLTALAESPVMFEGKPVPVSASIGYGQFPLPGNDTAVDWERAIALVDTAMYLSKAHGRNCACGIRRVDPPASDNLDLLTQTLETAWREGRVELHLQYGPALSPGSGVSPPAGVPGRDGVPVSPSIREAVQ